MMALPNWNTAHFALFSAAALSASCLLDSPARAQTPLSNYADAKG